MDNAGIHLPILQHSLDQKTFPEMLLRTLSFPIQQFVINSSSQHFSKQMTIRMHKIQVTVNMNLHIFKV